MPCEADGGKRHVWVDHAKRRPDHVGAIVDLGHDAVGPTSTGRLMLAVPGGLADVERDLIRTRTAEGRSRAKAKGKQMGRPPSLTPVQQKEATKRRAQGATLPDIDRQASGSTRARPCRRSL